MKRALLLWVLILLTTPIFLSAVNAQESDQEVTDDDVNRVARELYCPICENTPLDVCETQACEDWRQLIRQKLEAGQSEGEIIEYFAEIYGERARATPATSGLSLLVWILPIAGVVIGGAVFARLLRRWLARGTAVASTDVSISDPSLNDLGKDDTELDDYVARLEQEIQDSS